MILFVFLLRCVMKIQELNCDVFFDVFDRETW